MKQLRFSYLKTAGVSADRLAILGDRLQPEIARISAAWGAGYKTPYASLSLPSDDASLADIQCVIKEKQALEPSILVVIGMGGSNLGACAVHEALSGFFYNEQNPALRVYFADTLDVDYIKSIYQACDAALQKGSNVLLAVISKSGTTTETIANAQLFADLLQKYKQDYTQYIVAITDKGSKLWDTAHKQNITCLSVPQLVGGRFSVFSAVGLFPLGMLGVAIKDLLSGAESMKKPCTDSEFADNPAALSAAILYEQYQHGCTIHDTFLFVRRLHCFGMWYRQLVGESLGKRADDEKKERVGITPTVSVGPTDLHSVAQLYLGGPYNRITTFISAQLDSSIQVPVKNIFDSLVPMIQGKSYAVIMRAIELGTQRAYHEQKRPFMTLELPEISAYYVGQLMQMKMLEIMYLGFLFQVNPFDQPQVELYKKETRKILSHE